MQKFLQGANLVKSLPAVINMNKH